MVSADLVGCSTAWNKGTCGNRLNIRRDRLEARVLTALKDHLINPELFAVFCEEFTRWMNERRMEASAALGIARSGLARVDRQIRSMIEAIKNGMFQPSMKAEMDGLEHRKAELTATLASSEEPPPVLHPSMAVVYRERVAALHEALQQDDTRAQSAEMIRSLVSEIVLTPEGGALQIDVRGDLAGILTIAASGNQKSPPLAGTGSGGGSQVMMVAGTGFEPVTFRL